MKDQKRWMKNWIRALVVGTLIAGTVPLSVMAEEKGWVNENGAVHFVDSNGSYAKNEWKTSQGVSYYLDGEGNLAKEYLDRWNLLCRGRWQHDKRILDLCG